MRAALIVLCLALLAICPPPPARADTLAQARAAAQAGQYQQAVGLYSRVIEQEGLSGGELARALHQRGLAWMNQGKLEAALADFNQALQADQDLVAVYASRSLAYERKGLLERAYVDAEWYAHYKPDDPQARQRLRRLTRLMMSTPKKK